ncbi:MAG: tetratricopeptide repeat protein [Fidelibacterota bacterium]
MNSSPFTSRTSSRLIFMLILTMIINDSLAEGVEKKKDSRFHFFQSFISAVKNGDNRLFEAIVRPMEFRHPIVSIPAEGRYGIGFYGWKNYNPYNFDPNLITYVDTTEDIFQNIALSGRIGSSMEFDAVQSNLSYLFFKKSYLDVLAGIGVRRSAVFNIPSVELSKSMVLSGPPDVPSSWTEGKVFTPTFLEGNLSTTVIMQWHPKWFVQFRYGYGLGKVQFYRSDSLEPFPSGRGATAMYGVGIKFIRESDTAARYAWGFELRHYYAKVDNINDPQGITPITGMQLPQVGIYFSFGAFYGGSKTVGDEAKEYYLNDDYVTAKRKFNQFINQHPGHARVRRAKKLIEICDARIPQQLYSEGKRLEARDLLAEALGKYIEAERTAVEPLKKKLQMKIEMIAGFYIEIADSLFLLGRDDDALNYGRRAASISLRGEDFLRQLEARIIMRQGEELASHGVYSLALEKYSKALSMAPEFRNEIRGLELQTAVGMLADVNQAQDEAGLRLAVLSLYRAQEILGKKDEEMENIRSQLEAQLLRLDALKVNQLKESYANEARVQIALRHLPKVELGMLVSEVSDILGEPEEIIEKVDEKGRNYQLWIYHFPERGEAYFSFEDFVLFKIEEK